MDWYDLTDKYHEQTHDGDLGSLPELWQRELAALWRLEADINNGGYLQFLANWGTDSYRYGLAALRKIGAKSMATIVADCHATISRVVNIDELSADDIDALLPNPVIDSNGNVIKEAGSSLSSSALKKLDDLSFKFMDYPDDLPELGLKYYSQFVST